MCTLSERAALDRAGARPMSVNLSDAELAEASKCRRTVSVCTPSKRCKAGTLRLLPLRLTPVPDSASVHEHPGVLYKYKPLAGKSPMLETAAVWLDEAMTPVLRAFLDEAVPSHHSRASQARSCRSCRMRRRFSEGVASNATQTCGVCLRAF